VGSVFYRRIKTGAVDSADIRPYQVEGVGKDHIPGAMDPSVIDEAMQYQDQDAFEMCQRTAQHEGIFPGLSAGGNLAGVAWLINQLPGPARIVTLIQDAGTNYLSKLLSA
jgi:cysteine synthase